METNRPFKHFKVDKAHQNHFLESKQILNEDFLNFLIKILSGGGRISLVLMKEIVKYLQVNQVECQILLTKAEAIKVNQNPDSLVSH